MSVTTVFNSKSYYFVVIPPHHKLSENKSKTSDKINIITLFGSDIHKYNSKNNCLICFVHIIYIQVVCPLLVLFCHTE